MDFKQYASILRRRAWILIIGVIVFSLGSYIGSMYITPIFQASTKLLVSRPPDSKTSEFTYLSDQQLAQTYIQLLTTEPVLNSVSQQLNYKIEPEQIGGQIIRDTLIIRITVDDSNPITAANIANTLVKVLIDENEKIQSSRFSASEQSLNTQLAQVEKQISDLQKELAAASEESLKIQQTDVQKQITDLQSQILGVQQEISQVKNGRDFSSLSSEEALSVREKELRLEQLNSTLKFYQQIYLGLIGTGNTTTNSGVDSAHLEQMKNTLVLYQQIYANLLGSYESVRLARLSTTPNIVQVEVATIPEEPIRPKPLLNTALGGIIGLFIMLGVIFLIEYLDDTDKTPEDVSSLMGIPVIAFIGDMGYSKNNNSRPIIHVQEQPRSPIAEAFRTLRTNLEFVGLDKPLKTLLITSPSPGEGKTTISVNLAMTIAQSGKKVILVDADLRRPKIHRFLSIPNRAGLSDILMNYRPLQSVARPWRDTLLSVIPSGTIPPNPAEMLASDRMLRFLEDLSSLADLVIIDSPPILVSDASILASIVDGVIMIINPGETQRDAAWATYEQLKRVNANMVGVVFNRIPKHRSDYYGNYRYYSEYYYSSKYKGYHDDGRLEPKTGEKSQSASDHHAENQPEPHIEHHSISIEGPTQPTKIPAKD